MHKSIADLDVFQVINTNIAIPQHVCRSAVPSKKAVSANIKHSRYSIKHPIASQSTTVVKGCMYICLVW